MTSSTKGKSIINCFISSDALLTALRLKETIDRNGRNGNNANASQAFQSIKTLAVTQCCVSSTHVALLLEVYFEVDILGHFLPILCAL